MAEAKRKPSTLVPLWDGLLLFAERERCPLHLAKQRLPSEIAAKRVRYRPDNPDIAAFWRRVSGQETESEAHGRIQFPEIHWEEGFIAFNIGGTAHTYLIEVAREDVALPSPPPPSQVEAQDDPGWQEERTHLKLNVLEDEGLVLARRALMELRTQLVALFEDELIEIERQNKERVKKGQKPLPLLPIPSPRVMNKVIKERQKRRDKQ
jgi:hypothetical protein